MSQATYLIFLLIFALNLISTRADIDDLKTITLKDITSGKFPLRGFNGVWTSRKQFVYMTEEGLVEYDLEFETKTVLLKQEVLVRDFSHVNADKLLFFMLHNFSRVNGTLLQ